MSNVVAMIVVSGALYAVGGFLFGGASVVVLSDWLPRGGALSDARAFACWLFWPALLALVIALAAWFGLVWLYRVPGRMFRAALRD
jgi:hypothetical protein